MIFMSCSLAALLHKAVHPSQTLWFTQPAEWKETPKESIDECLKEKINENKLPCPIGLENPIIIVFMICCKI